MKHATFNIDKNANANKREEKREEMREEMREEKINTINLEDNKIITSIKPIKVTEENKI